MLAFAGALATVTLAAAAGPIPNVDVTAMPGNEAEDAIAVNPTAPSNVVAMSTLSDAVAGLAVGVSFDSGQTWARRLIGTSTAVGPGGQVMVTYQNSTNGQGGADIYAAVDTDGLGPAGFGKPALVTHSHVGGFDYIAAQPHRSVDAEANLAWDRSGGARNGRV